MPSVNISPLPVIPEVREIGATVTAVLVYAVIRDVLPHVMEHAWHTRSYCNAPHTSWRMRGIHAGIAMHPHTSWRMRDIHAAIAMHPHASWRMRGIHATIAVHPHTSWRMRGIHAAIAMHLQILNME